MLTPENEMFPTAKKMIVSIDFRDWKWISNFHRFQTEITDQSILNGSEDGSIEVDFSKLQ